MGDKNKGSVPPPDYAKLYEQGRKLNLKYTPKDVAADLALRQQFDPLLTEQAMGFQEKYDPRLAQEQYDALQRRDPQWLALHQGLGDKIKEALDRGYVDPRQEAAYQKYSQLAGRGEPTRDAAYQALGKQVTGDTLRGATMDPETLRQTTQAILSRSPGLSYGEAQDMAAAVYTGQRGQQLKQQRQQATGQFLQTATPTAQREQSLANFYGMQAPEMQAYGLAGTYIQPSNSLVGAENMIGGVQAPRSFGYMNPQAGNQAAQFGLQNYQNMVAANGGGSGGGNPWMNALQGASTGMSYGSVGGGYGMAGGAIVGGVAGGLGYPQYSDLRWKQNLSRTGIKTPDGIEIVEYDMDGKRYRGVIAQEVLGVRPEAVYRFPDGRLGVFYKRIGVEQQEVK